VDGELGSNLRTTVRSEAQQQVLNCGWLGQGRVMASVELDDGAGFLGEIALLPPRGGPCPWAQTR